MKVHPKAAKYRLMADEALIALTDSILDNGQREPVTYSKGPASPGYLVDGRNRLRACELAHVAPLTQELAFETEADIVAFIEDKNDHRRHLTAEELSALAEERRLRVIAAREAGKSFRAIAKEENVSLVQVQRDLSSGVPPGTPEKVQGKDGKTYPASRPLHSPSRSEIDAKASEVFSEKPASSARRACDRCKVLYRPIDLVYLGGKIQLLLCWACHDLVKEEAERAEQCDEEGHERCGASETVEVLSRPTDPASPVLKKGVESQPEEEQCDETPPKGPPAVMASGFDGWNTPAYILDVVREFGGNEIALDPCSNPHSIVGAKLALTKEDDGLSRDWVAVLESNGLAGGLVFVNPPYDQEMLEKVFAHCAHQHGKGVEIVALVPTKNDQRWYQLAMKQASGYCLVEGRVPFGKEGNWKVGASAFPLTIFHWGPDTEGFCALFASLGFCLDLTLYRNSLEEREAM